jgi:hypothetical protein
MSLEQDRKGYSRYWKPFLKKVRPLTPQDVGKKIMKFGRVEIEPGGSVDCSYCAPRVFVLRELEFEKVCSNIKCKKKDCTLKCSRCKCNYYCNKDCQKVDWSHHKKQCGRSSVNRRITKMVIDEDPEPKFNSMKSPREIKSEYYSGWALVDEIEGIEPDMTPDSEEFRRVNIEILMGRDKSEYKLISRPYLDIFIN